MSAAAAVAGVVVVAAGEVGASPVGLLLGCCGPAAEGVLLVVAAVLLVPVEWLPGPLAAAPPGASVCC